MRALVAATCLSIMAAIGYYFWSEHQAVQERERTRIEIAAKEIEAAQILEKQKIEKQQREEQLAEERKIQADPFLTACESALKERLNAPATFNLINFNTSKKAGGARATEHTMFLTYDAHNRMGVPLRSIVACTYETTGSDASDASEFTVKIDGMGHVEWLIDQLAKSRSRR